MTFKEKVARFKDVLSNFDKLEKAVQSKLMDVADHLAPGVQGGEISPKQVVVPEPEEYPDIEIKVVNKHYLDELVEFHKSTWKPQPMNKTQKHPSTQVPYEQKAEHREYIKNPENNSAHMEHLRDDKAAVSPAPPAELHASGAMGKASAEKNDVQKDDSIATSINTAVKRAQEARGSKAPPPLPKPVAASIAGAFKSEAHPIENYATGFYKSSWKPEKIGKATIEGEIPARSAIKPASPNVPLEPSKKKS